MHVRKGVQSLKMAHRNLLLLLLEGAQRGDMNLAAPILQRGDGLSTKGGKFNWVASKKYAGNTFEWASWTHA